MIRLGVDQHQVGTSSCSPLKIERIEVFATAIPFEDAHPAARAWYGQVSKQVTVKVFAGGLYGIGESFAYGAPKAIVEVIETIAAPVLLNQDANQIGKLYEAMARATRIAGRSGIAAFATAALEIALWDLVGKARGLPVYELLGGALRTLLPSYVSLPRYDTPAAIAEESIRLVGEGFKSIKLHQTEIAPVIECRHAIGEDIDLILDTNAAWDEAGAIAMAKGLEPARLRWLEEPVWPPEDYPTLAKVRSAISTPISVGENEYSLTGFAQCLRDGAADILQPSVAKLGLGAMVKVANIANLHRASIVPHSFYFGPGLAATAHFVATLPGESLIEFPHGNLGILREPLMCKSGNLNLPTGPGLGVELDEGAIAQHLITKRILKI